MEFIEFLGFIITMIAMVFLLARRAREEKRRRANPEAYEQEESEKEEELRDFLRSLDPNLELYPPKPPPPPPKVAPPPPPTPKPVIKSEPVITPSQIEADHAYDITKKTRKRLFKDPRSLVIYKEILDKPKGLRFD